MKYRLTHITTALAFSGLSQVSMAQMAIPLMDDDIYYQIGGGRTYHLPPTLDKHSAPIGFDGELGLGYSCGVFNPAVSIKNSINRLKGTFQDIDKAIISNLTGAVVTFPMYMLSQVNPNLYNLINNNLINAHKQLELAMKNCEAMEAELADGKNPYDNWARISLGSTWKKEISLAGQTGQGDVLQAKKRVVGERGRKGVPWQGGKRAGGKGQQPIRVVRDTVNAGYNSLLNRPLNDVSISAHNHPMTQIWRSPQQAADWVIGVLGDKHITTCDEPDCQQKQNTTAGRGLIPDMAICSESNQAYCTPNLKQKITELVQGNVPVNAKSLQAISAPNMAITVDVIRALQQQEPLMQGISIDKLAQAMSLQQVVERALLARQLLQSGRQTPAVDSHEMAKTEIDSVLAQLDQALESLLFEQQIRQATTSDVLVTILNQHKRQTLDAGLSATSNEDNPQLIRDGGLQRNNVP